MGWWRRISWPRASLARYEREIASVFDTIEPAASTLAASGRISNARKAILKLIGAALLARTVFRAASPLRRSPTFCGNTPGVERFYAREDEYEIIERGRLLNGKVEVIASAAQTFTDMMDTARSARLEILIVVPILAELVIAGAALIK